jgi:uncharacterized protein (TIGR02266 family)
MSRSAPKPADLDREISLAEHAIAAEEVTLAADAERVETLARDLSARTQQHRGATAKAQVWYPRERTFVELHLRALSFFVSPLDIRAQQDVALQARTLAVDARRRAVETMKQVLEAHRAELSRIAAQLDGDEGALARCEDATRQQAEGVHPAPEPPRRASPRVRMQAAVDFHSDSNVFTGFSTNISDGGMFVATANTLAIGTEVDLALTLPSGERMSVRGVVRWARRVNDDTPEVSPGIGIQFVDLPLESAMAIHRFVATREPILVAD